MKSKWERETGLPDYAKRPSAIEAIKEALKERKKRKQQKKEK